MRACSLFAGIDAIGIAVGALGGETVSYSQYDPEDKHQYCQQVLTKRLPFAESLGDVTKVDWKEVVQRNPFDFASAGFP